MGVAVYWPTAMLTFVY